MPYDPQQLETDVDYLTKLPQWQDEAKRPQFIREVALKAGPNLDAQAHGEFANALWSRHTGGAIKQTVDFVKRGGEEIIKSIPAGGAAVAFAAGDAVGLSATGSGTRLKRGVVDLVDGTVQRAKQLASGEVLGMNLLPGESHQAKRDSTLAALKQSLDQGLYPQGIEQWMAGDFDSSDAKPDEETQQWIGLLTSGIAERAVAADHMGKPDPAKVRAWLESDRSPARTSSDIPGEPGPRELLADYVATRDPASWEAFQARVSETDSQHTTRLQRYAAEGEVRAVDAVRPDGLGKELATRGMDMQTSPIDLATVALPIFRGANALKAVRAGGSATKQVLKGMAGEAAQEGATEYLSDPNASTGRVLEALALGAVGQGVISAPMAGAGKLLRPSSAEESEQERMQREGTLPPPTADQLNKPPVEVVPAPRDPAEVNTEFQQSALNGIAQRAGAVDPLMPEHVSDLSAADVQDLETGLRSREAKPGDLETRQPILQNVPDAQNPLPPANPNEAQTITGSNEQTGSEMPVPPPTAAAGAGAGATVIEQRGDWLQSSVVGGTVGGRVQGGVLRISAANLDESQRGTGQGRQMYQTLVDHALSNGLQVTSDNTVDEGAVRVYESLKRAGYAVQRNPSAFEVEVDGRKALAAPAGQPVYTIASSATSAPASQSPSPQVSQSESPGLTHLTLSRDLQSGFMTTAGADALLDLAHRAFRAGQTFVQWSKTMLQRFGESIRQWLAGAWDHAKRSSQIGAVNFTGKLGNDLQKAAQQARGVSSGSAQTGLYEAVQQGDLNRAAQIAAALGFNVGPVFHGTTSANRLETLRTEHHAIHSPELNTRLGAMFAVNRSASERFATGDIAKARGSKNGRVIASFLNIKNPLEFETTTAPGSTLERAIKAAGFLSKSWSKTNLERIQQRVWKTYGRDTLIEARPDLAANQAFELRLLSEEEMANAFKAQAIAAGHDGIYVKQDFSLGPVWIAFREDQIKLVDLKADAESLAGSGAAGIKPKLGERGGVTVRDSQQPEGAGNIPAPSPGAVNSESLRTAYMAAMQGRSSAMVPIKDVYEQAKAQNPLLTPQQFMAEVQAGDNAGTVLLEPPEKADTVAAAGPFVLRNASGIPSTSMMVQRGFTHLDVSGQRSQAGFVMGPGKPDKTRSRFARPDEDEHWYETRQDGTVKFEAANWLDARTLADAVDQLTGTELPPGITSEDVRQQVFGMAIRRAMQLLDQGDEFARTNARVLANKAARLYQDAGRESARAMRQRAVVNHELQPYAPILAAEGLLIDRADAVMDKRFDGGAVGGAAKVKKVADDSSAEAGGELGADIEAETSGTETSPQGTKVPAQKRRGALKQKQPNLAKLLNELRKKMFPGMNWQAIFEQLPSQQRERQREIYTRLRKDERLRNLNQAEVLQLTNELDKAWQRERRKVFMRELGKAGALGEKEASDRQKAQKAMPKLLRAINLGLMTSETFREAVAPEYGLRMLTQAEAAQLRSMAEKAYEQPVGVLRNKLLAEMLTSIQSKVKGTWIEILNSYWTAAVLSGLRTQFDTFMAAANGLGTNLIQAGTLAARGKFTAAKEVHAEWWRGFGEGARESLRILAKGDYSLTKRFNLDLQKALEGDEHYRPVPLSETLFQEANWWQKAPAAVMMFVGRAMTAADHINNTATTRGAMAVARALNPELYAHKAGFTVTEREAAFQQALNEVSGGNKINLTKDQQATLSARTREILYSGVKPADAAAASEVGDMAAYQNDPDPTGVFGWVYEGMKSGLGRAVSRLGTEAENVEASKARRAICAIMGGALYGITGTRFMRFGFNFGADLTRYVPGTYLLDHVQSLKLGFYGHEYSQQQRELLLGKNIVGLLIASTAAAWFLGKDDEEEGWHIEGPWNSLSLTDKNARRSAGIEPLSMWKRENGKLTRIYYKQWPTMGIFAAVGGMADEQRFEPGKFEQRGVTGHLLHAAATGLTQIQNVSAMRNLGELFAGSYTQNAEDVLVSKMSKTATNYVSGFVPRVIKDVDAWFDPQNYKPEGIMEQLIADQPMLRRLVNDSRPQLSVLGKPVQLNRAPWSRVMTSQSIGTEEHYLAQLMVRGINLPGASDKKMVFRDGAKQTLESLGPDVSWRYQKAVGEGYAELLRTNGQHLLTLPADQAQKWINTSAERIKSIAMMKVMQP